MNHLLPARLCAALVVALLAGCTGLGASSSLTCPLPAGSHCDSVSNTYTGATRGELAGQRRLGATVDVPPAAPAGTALSAAAAAAVTRTVSVREATVGMPLRSQARVVRVWIKPWEDADGDLHDQSYVYLAVSEGEWALGSWQRNVRDGYAPAPARPQPASAGASGPAAAAGLGGGHSGG